MFYMVSDIVSPSGDGLSTFITTSQDKVELTIFRAEVGNPNYDQFLEQAGLTDTEVHELEPDVWYDLPE